MEIEFNPSRAPTTGYTDFVKRQGAAQASAQNAAPEGAASLASKLNDIPLSRPEKVSQAQAVVSDEKYPPYDLMDRIAVLIAARIQQVEE